MYDRSYEVSVKMCLIKYNKWEEHGMRSYKCLGCPILHGNLCLTWGIVHVVAQDRLVHRAKPSDVPFQFKFHGFIVILAEGDMSIVEKECLTIPDEIVEVFAFEERCLRLTRPTHTRQVGCR